MCSIPFSTGRFPCDYLSVQNSSMLVYKECLRNVYHLQFGSIDIECFIHMGFSPGSHSCSFLLIYRSKVFASVSEVHFLCASFTISAHTPWLQPLHVVSFKMLWTTNDKKWYEILCHSHPTYIAFYCNFKPSFNLEMVWVRISLYSFISILQRFSTENISSNWHVNNLVNIMFTRWLLNANYPYLRADAWAHFTQ